MSRQRVPLNKPSSLRRKIKLRLSEAQNWRCCYCGIRMEGSGNEDNAPTFEHVVPLRDGGVNTPDENIVIACRSCNMTRGRREEFLHG